MWCRAGKSEKGCLLDTENAVRTLKIIEAIDEGAVAMSPRPARHEFFQGGIDAVALNVAVKEAPDLILRKSVVRCLDRLANYGR